VNSGAEADENAVKIARGFTGKGDIIVFSHAFHGRTMLTMEMTANKNYATGMAPFPPGVHRVTLPFLYHSDKPEAETITACLDELEAKIKEVGADKLAAVVFEPLQGEGGFIPAPIEWVKGVREICDRNKILMIADEVQTGWARTGRLFASEYFAEVGAAPDIMTTAKSIAGGLPLSAVTTSTEIMDGIPAGTIGGTYCGNPVACASALALIKMMEDEDYPKKSRIIGDVCMKRFGEMRDKYEVFGDVRGMGAMIGLEFVTDKASKEPNKEVVASIISKALQKGLFLGPAGAGNGIRFLCPLCVTPEQLEKGLEIFEECLKESI
ncbi:MAG: aspartate aminotransferase family protein, partial [Anaerovoracaceae bacterium]